MRSAFDEKVRLKADPTGMKQTQHDGVADSDVGDQQQGPIDPRPRAPRGERVNAERR